MAQAPKKVVYVDMDEAAVCRSDGTIIPPKYRLPIKTTGARLVFDASDTSTEEVQDEPTPEEGS